MLATRDRVAVWMVDGRPVRLIWQGRRYRVNDTPTRINELGWHPAIMHPPAPIDGWRFQARDPHGDVRMFEISRVDGREEWELLRVYE